MANRKLRLRTNRPSDGLIEMPKPPFDVMIHVGAKGRGVYKLQPLAEGHVDGPDGPVKVTLGINLPVEETSEPTLMELTLFVGKQAVDIDVTDMMQRIAAELLRPDPRPTKTLEFKRKK